MTGACACAHAVVQFWSNVSMRACVSLRMPFHCMREILLVPSEQESEETVLCMALLPYSESELSTWQYHAHEVLARKR